jgi:HemY protein
MRVFFAILLVLLMAAALAAAIQYDPGYVLIAYGQTTIEMTLWVGVAVLVVVLVVALALFIGLRRGAKVSDRVVRFWSGRRLRRGRSKTTLGLIAYIEGNWAKSRRLLVESATETDAPLINYLLAARASQAMGENKATRRYLGLAESTSSRAGIAVELTQAELLLENGQFEEALATLTRVRRNAVKHPSVLRLLKRVYLELNDWSGLLSLLPELRKHQVYSEDSIQALERQALMGNLEKVSQKGQLEELQNWWKSLSKNRQRDLYLVTAYAQKLQQLGEDGAAESVLRQILKVQWSEDIVALYGRLQPKEADAQLATAELWLKDHPGNVELLLALGRISLRNQLWGKAREYFETAYMNGKNYQICLELGRLLSNMGEQELGNHYTREALDSFSNALPVLPQPKKNF